jgi:hemoglobin
MTRTLLPLLLLTACVEVGTAPPPTAPPAGDAPTLTILSPADGATVDPAADADLAVSLEVAIEGLTLRSPGTCTAADAPCGWILIKVDGTSCADDGAVLNGRAWANPVLARVGLCPEAGGEHRIELELADSSGEPIAGTATSIDVVVNEPSLLARLGGEDAMRGHVDAWVELHLLSDRNSHGWLHDDRVDRNRVVDCTSELLSDLAGGTTEYGTSVLGCPALGAADGGLFAGRGLSAVDYDDAARHLHDALLYHAIDPGSADALLDELDAVVRSTIVEDESNDASLYQRLGRYAGILTVVDDFAGRIIADPTIGPFFAVAQSPPDYPARTGVCIARTVCGAGAGPCGYGHGTEPELEGVPCLSMAASHEHLRAPQDDPDGPAIALNHFDLVVAHLVQALTDAGVPADDIGLVGAALSPTCADIVQVDPGACGG